jgi:hypothetical protein
MDSNSPELQKSCSSRLLATAALVAAAVVVLTEAVYTVLRSATIYDEGGYLYEGWLVCARGLRPYIDFHTKVTPLLYYFYGWPQAAFGPGMLVGRIEASLASLLAMALLAWALGRRYGTSAAALTLAAFAMCLAGLDQYFRALAIAPCALWIALGILGISFQPCRWAWMVTGLAAGLLFLSRQDLVAPAIMLIVMTAVAGKRARRGGYAALVALAVVGIGLAPFLSSSRSDVLAIASLGLLREPGPKLGPIPFAVTERLSLHNLPWYLEFLAKVYITPLVWLLAALVVVLTKPVARVLARHPVPVACLAVAISNPVFRGLGALATHRNAFYLRDFYIEMALMAGAAAALTAAYRAAKPSQRQFVILAGVLGLLLAPPAMRVPASLRPHHPTELQGIHEAGRFIASTTTPDDRIFALEDPHVFLEAGRSLLPMLTHHLFLYRPQDTTEALRGTKSFNLEMLLDMLRHDATVAVITERGMTWIAHNERTTEGVKVVAAVHDELRRNWTQVAEAHNSFLGAVQVYRRRPQPPTGSSAGTPRATVSGSHP